MRHKLAILLMLTVISGHTISCNNNSPSTDTSVTKTNAPVSDTKNLTLIAYQDINGNVSQITKKNILSAQLGSKPPKSVSSCATDCPPISDYGINTRGNEPLTLKLNLPAGGLGIKAEGTQEDTSVSIVIPYNLYKNIDGDSPRQSLVYLIKAKNPSQKKKFTELAVMDFFEISGAEVDSSGKVSRVATIQSSDEKDLTFFTADQKVMGFNLDNITQGDTKSKFSRAQTEEETKYLNELKSSMDNILSTLKKDAPSSPEPQVSEKPSATPKPTGTPTPVPTPTPTPVPTPIGPAPEKLTKKDFANGVEYNSFNRFSDNKVLCQTTKHWEAEQCQGNYGDETQFLFVSKVKEGVETKYYHDISSAEIGDWKEGDKVSVMMFVHNSARTHLDDISNRTFMAQNVNLKLNLNGSALNSEISAKNTYLSDLDYQNKKSDPNYVAVITDTANIELPGTLKLAFDNTAASKVKWFRNKPVSECESFKTGEVVDCSVDSDPDSSKYTIKDNEFNFTFGDLPGGYYFSQWIYVNLIVAKK